MAAKGKERRGDSRVRAVHVVNGSIHSFTPRALLFCQRQIYTPPLEGGPHRTPPLRPYTRRMRR